MYFASSNFVADLCAAFLVGLSGKLLDDYMDRERDLAWGRPSLAKVLDGALIPYSFVCLAVATALSPRLAASLALACYVVGMTRDLDKRFPILGMPGYVESAIITVVGIALLGLWEMVSSLALIFLIQLADDIIDYAREKFPETRNLVRVLGRGEASLLAIIALLIALMLDPRKVVLVIVAASGVWLLSNRIATREASWDGD